MLVPAGTASSDRVREQHHAHDPPRSAWLTHAAGEEQLRLLWKEEPVARVPGIGFYFSDAKSGIPSVLQVGH